MGRPGTQRALIAAGLLCCILIPRPAPVSAAQADAPLRVLSQNMNRLFDDVDDGNREKILTRERFQQRVAAAAKKFTDDYGLPHIIALQEVENVNVLRAIAAGIERRSGAKFRPVLMPGNDVSGINLGYLVRRGIEIRNAGQLFRERDFGFDGSALFSRPPLYLEACYIANCLTLLNLHLRSMRDIGDAVKGNRVRQKRLRQAETVADWSNRQLRSNPGISLLLLGDFNALTPPDAFVDVAGILRGNPIRSGVALPGRDLLDPDLIDLTELIPAPQRYSFIFRRKRQQLDYMLVNQGFGAAVEAIQFGRIDYRFSDHAGLLARFRW